MKATIEYKRFFAYSEDKNKYFNTEFRPGINLIYGKNTSGKSTVMQAIHYTFGINDEKYKLAEVLNEKVVFRLDFVLKKEFTENISIIRDDEFIVIKRENQPIIKFTGISGNNSEEHKILKEYLGNLFGFNLYLESSGEYKQASIEAMFLPYYVAQDVGWVYRHKSFRGLDYVKNFKRDFFDYYLGIINDYNREEKQKLENEKKLYENQINFLSETESKNDELQLSKLKDEKFIIKANEYIDRYKNNKTTLIEDEKEYLLACNKLTFLNERYTVLKKVRTALKNQNPLENDCPTCKQNLPNNIEAVYEYFQDIGDTEKQLQEIDKNGEKLKKLKGKINSLELKIEEQRKIVSKDYDNLLKYNIEDLSFNTWIDNKANVKLSENILTQIREKTIELDKVNKNLKDFKTDDEIINERNSKDYTFKGYFETYLSELGVKKFNNDSFLLLYKIPAFPQQGVELLQTLLAYNFAFNKIIKKTEYVHRFPFMMDAIFKEDIEDTNKSLILKFIYKNKLSDTQIIMSIADSEDNVTSAIDYNREYLNNEAYLILINNERKRAFLSDYSNEYESYLKQTLKYIE